MTELTLSTGHPLKLEPASVKDFKGKRLPGAEYLHAREAAYAVSFHEYAQKLFRYSVRNFHCVTGQTFVVRENSKYIRLEAVITGELSIMEPDGKMIKLLAGQYRITGTKIFHATFGASHGCEYFVAFLSPELLSQTPMENMIVPGGPLQMTQQMREVIHKITDNPFEEKFRDAFYDYGMRELLFYHVSAPPLVFPGEMTQAEIAAVYEADAIIAQDLSVHYSIQELAQRTRTNTYTLKTGFSKIFGMGTYERLLHRKMERAKYLLESTDRQIQEVSVLAGYETVTGFINAFRKQFNMTPKDWRKRSRGLL